ncbi:hypothetical protein EHS43_43200, partial [Streptomyces sp. RP5T]
MRLRSARRSCRSGRSGQERGRARGAGAPGRHPDLVLGVTAVAAGAARAGTPAAVADDLAVDDVADPLAV